MIRLRPSSVLQHLGLAIALVGFGLLCPSQVQAGCGADYIVVTENKNSPEHRPLSTPTIPMTAHDHGDMPKKPCQGPNCQKAPEQLPLAPLPAPIQLNYEVKALFEHWALGADSAPYFTFARSSQVATIARPLAIFHPPRG
jgi:hypothetical protein